MLFHVVIRQNFVYFVCSETSIDLATDSDNRSKTACANAAEAVEREEAILSGLAHLDAELTLELLEDTLRSAHVAGSTHTNRDWVFALRLHSEVAIESHHAINACNRDVELGCNLLLDLAWQIAEDILALMEDCDELAAIVVMVCTNGANFLEDFFLAIILFRSDYFL